MNPTRVRLPGVRDRAVETVRAIRFTLGRRDSLAVVGVVTLGYLLAYLWAAGDLSVRTDVRPDLLVITDPFGRMFARTGPVSFDAIAILDTGVLRLLVSPVNIGIGFVLAVLVGLSLGLTYLAIVQPRSCGIGAGSGLAASVPAILSGSVCCGPVVLIALGIQASGLLLTMFAWLLPVGVILLVGSIVYVAGKIDLRHTHGGGIRTQNV